jgi:acetylornithine/succinyldiaminopimelate/putrescine aminotransferase
MTAANGDIFRLGFEEFREFVNPFVAGRAQASGEPIRLLRAEGGRLWDIEGRATEDLHGTQMFGHRHPAITAAVQAYLSSDAPSWYPSRVNPFMGRLARRLCERTGYSNVFFGLSGSDAVEAGIKLARALTGKPRLLGLDRAYHGCSMGSLSLMHRGPLRDPFGPHLPGAESLPTGDIDALARALAPGDVAAVVVEPIQGEGGVLPLSEPYIAALCELTERHGALLIADEIQTGLGRCGRFLASGSWPRRPDVALLAKHLGGGITPLSAMLTRRELFERAYGADFEDGESHNSTFSNNALAAVAALAVLDLITPEVMARVAARGAAFRAQIREGLAGSPLFREVRGEGFMMGISLVQPDHPWVSFEQFGYPELDGRPTIGALLAHRLYRRGYFAFVCGHDWSILRLQPRMTIEQPILDGLAVAIIEEASRLAELI